MSDPAFFGYGSLVNLATHSYANPRPATLQGWRRIWRGTHLRKVAYLSIHPVAGHALDGIVAQVPGADWSKLDAREAAYQRRAVTTYLHPKEVEVTTAVYQVHPEHLSTKSEHPILLSYLDTVVQGYLAVFGEAGVAEFFATTDGWDAPLLDDRVDPVYPRAQRLTADERTLVDDHLSAVMQQAE